MSLKHPYDFVIMTFDKVKKKDNVERKDNEKQSCLDMSK